MKTIKLKVEELYPDPIKHKDYKCICGGVTFMVERKENTKTGADWLTLTCAKCNTWRDVEIKEKLK